jgi:hypothetical protein
MNTKRIHSVIYLHIIKIGRCRVTTWVHLWEPWFAHMCSRVWTAIGMVPKCVQLYRLWSRCEKNSRCSGKMLSAAATKYVQTRAWDPSTLGSRSRTVTRSRSTDCIDSSSEMRWRARFRYRSQACRMASFMTETLAYCSAS